MGRAVEAVLLLLLVHAPCVVLPARPCGGFVCSDGEVCRSGACAASTTLLSVSGGGGGGGVLRAPRDAEVSSSLQPCSPLLRQYSKLPCPPHSAQECTAAGWVHNATGVPAFVCTAPEGVPAPVRTLLLGKTLRVGETCQTGHLLGETWRDNSGHCEVGSVCKEEPGTDKWKCTLYTGCLHALVEIDVGKTVNTSRCETCTCSNATTPSLTCTSLCPAQRAGDRCEGVYTRCKDSSLCIPQNGTLVCVVRPLLNALGSAVTGCLLRRPGCAPHLAAHNALMSCAVRCRPGMVVEHDSPAATSFCATLTTPPPTASLATLQSYHNTAAFCCVETDTHCTTFNCTWGAASTAPFLAPKRDYCHTSAVRVDSAPLRRSRRLRQQQAWKCLYQTPPTPAKAKQCCSHHGLHCESEPCLMDLPTNITTEAGIREYVTTHWSKQQRDTCCAQHNVFCTVDCHRGGNIVAGDVPVEELLSDEERVQCCETHGLYCGEKERGKAGGGASEVLQDFVSVGSRDVTDVSWFAAMSPEARAAAVSSLHVTSHEIHFSYPLDTLFENPKRFLASLRRALLAASSSLREHPERLLITSIGALLPDLSSPLRPPTSPRFFVETPFAWNALLFRGDADFVKGWEGGEGGGGGGNATETPEGYWHNGGSVFAAFLLASADAGVVRAISEELAVSLSVVPAEGVITQAGGKALALHSFGGLRNIPNNNNTGDTPPPESSSDGLRLWVLILVVVLALLLVLAAGAALRQLCWELRARGSPSVGGSSGGDRGGENTSAGATDAVPKDRPQHTPAWGEGNNDVQEMSDSGAGGEMGEMGDTELSVCD